MSTTVESKPAFTIKQRTPEQLGELFVSTAQAIVAGSPSTSDARGCDHAFRLAALFVEHLAEIQSNQ